MSIKDQLRAAILSGGAEGPRENLSTSVHIPTTSPYVAPSNGTVVTAATEPTWINIVTIPVRKGELGVYAGFIPAKAST